MPSCRRGALAQVDRGAYLQQRVAHVAVEQRPHPEVADGHVGFCGKVYFAVYARHAPVVGIFEVTAVRPFENLHGERVLAGRSRPVTSNSEGRQLSSAYPARVPLTQT